MLLVVKEQPEGDKFIYLFDFIKKIIENEPIFKKHINILIKCLYIRLLKETLKNNVEQIINFLLEFDSRAA